MDFRTYIVAHFLSLIFNIIAGIAMIVLVQATWRSGMPKDENLKLSVGGVLAIVLGILIPGSFLPVLVGITWILVVYLRLEKIESPHLWAVVAALGVVMVFLSGMALSWVATPIGVLGGCYTVFLALKKIPRN